MRIICTNRGRFSATRDGYRHVFGFVLRLYGFVELITDVITDLML